MSDLKFFDKKINQIYEGKILIAGQEGMVGNALADFLKKKFNYWL